MGIKLSPKQLVCDGCVKYKKAEDYGLVAILETNNWGG